MSSDPAESPKHTPILDPIEAANAELRGMASPRLVDGVGARRRKRQRENDWLCEEMAPASEGIAERVLSPDALAQLKLSLVSGVGPRMMTALLYRFGSAVAVFKASSESLASVDGIGPKLVSEIKLRAREGDVDGIVHWCQHHDTQILTLDDEGYPSMLEDLCDAPPILFCRGEILPQDSMAVSIVGTRHASTYGLRQAEQLAYALAKAGVTVVSGLARGIDTAAHEGALNAGGRTIAVLGGGLGQMYPSENGGLAKAISADGAVISEQPPMVKPRGPLFPQRNRIVAALGLATLVIEAPQRSGSLITARLAGETNRDVLALPGPVTSRASRGCNELIRDGATLVQNVDDILEVLGPMRSPVETADGHTVHNPGELKLNEIERKVLSAIESESTAIDQVIAASELPAHRVMSVISILEMRRLIKRISGQYVSRI